MDALQRMVAQKQITWPQVCQAKEGDEALIGLFNVQGTPTYYLIDREGKIAAKDVPGKKLSEMVATLLQK